MKRVSTAELLRNFGQYSDAAMAGPLVITKSGRDRLVLISVEQYNIFQHVSDAYEDTRPSSGRERAKASPRRLASRRAG